MLLKSLSDKLKISYYQIRSKNGKNLKYCPDGSSHEMVIFAPTEEGGYRSICQKCERECMVTVKGASWFGELTKWYEKGKGQFHSLEEIEKLLYMCFTLGIKPGDSISNIKKAYRKLALKYHPDHGGDPIRFQKIDDAYRTIISYTEGV